MQLGAEVVYSSLEISMFQDMLVKKNKKLMLSLTKPKYFIPVHGEYRQLIAHAETAKKLEFQMKTYLENNGRRS